MNNKIQELRNEVTWAVEALTEKTLLLHKAEEARRLAWVDFTKALDRLAMHQAATAVPSTSGTEGK